MHLQLLSTEEARALEREWSELARGIEEARPWHFPQWQWAFARHLMEREDELVVIAGREGGQLRAVFPLVRRMRKVNGKQARWAQFGYHGHAPYGDAPAEEGTVRAELADAVMQCAECDVLGVPMALEDSFIGGMLREAANGRGDRSGEARTRWERLTHADVLAVGDYQRHLEGLSKNFRGNLRKARNKLAAAGRVEHRVASVAEDLPRALEEFLRLEQSGWKGSAGTAIAKDAKLRGFYEDLVQGFGAMGGCEIHLLDVDGRAIAANFCVSCGATCHVLKIGYDESQRLLAPGNMLLEHVMKRCELEERVRWVHLMSDAKWHEDWNCQRQDVVRGEVVANTAAGRSILRRRAMKQRLQPVVNAAKKMKGAVKRMMGRR